ncbi:MAG: flavodoxin family protein [Cyanobacteriota bacterium]
MKITAFNGSPKAENSATNVIVQEFLTGAKEAGAETENVFLAHKKIHHCIGCFTCWMKTPGKCAMNDDMAELLEIYINSDIIVFASPVYVGGVTGIMKDFLDRLIPVADPHIALSKDGISYHKSRISKDSSTGIVIISNCGFPENVHFDYFKSCFKYLELMEASKIVGEIYRSQGPMLLVDNPLLNLIVDGYKKKVRKAGKEVVEKGIISPELQEDMIKPLIPYNEYNNFANQHFDKILASIQ